MTKEPLSPEATKRIGGEISRVFGIASEAAGRIVTGTLLTGADVDTIADRAVAALPAGVKEFAGEILAEVCDLLRGAVDLVRDVRSALLRADK